MLEPNQFDVNEAWLVFQLNEAPVATEADGDFNVVCLMDAASCYILATAFVSTQTPLSEQIATDLLETGRSKGTTLPKKLMVSCNLGSDPFSVAAKRLGVAVVLESEDSLLPFTSEAKEGFRAHIGGDRMQ